MLGPLALLGVPVVGIAGAFVGLMIPGLASTAGGMAMRF